MFCYAYDDFMQKLDVLIQLILVLLSLELSGKLKIKTSIIYFENYPSPFNATDMPNMPVPGNDKVIRHNNVIVVLFLVAIKLLIEGTNRNIIESYFFLIVTKNKMLIINIILIIIFFEIF